MNRTELVGRIVRDIELRKTQSGKSTTSFTLAVNKPVKDSQADFIPCVAWDKTADFLRNYCGKGCLISVEGRISTRSFQTKDGRTQYVTEVIADRVQLLSKPQAEPRYEAEETPLPEQDLDDLLPF
mgnify:FL=1